MVFILILVVIACALAWLGEVLNLLVFSVIITFLLIASIFVFGVSLVTENTSIILATFVIATMALNFFCFSKFDVV